MSLVNLMAQSYSTPLALTPDYWIPQDTHLHPSELKDLPDSLKPQIARVLDAEYIEDSDSTRLSPQQQLALGFKDPKQRIKQKWIYQYLQQMMPQYQDEAMTQIKNDDEMLDEDLEQYKVSHKQNLKSIEALHNNWEVDEMEDEEDEENEQEEEFEKEVEAEAEEAVDSLESLELDENDKKKLMKSTQYLKKSFEKAAKLSKLAKVAEKSKKIHRKKASAVKLNKRPVMKIDQKVSALQTQIEELKAQLAEKEAHKDQVVSEIKQKKKVVAPKKVKIAKPMLAKKIQKALQRKSNLTKPQIKAKVVKKLMKKEKNNALLKQKLAQKYILVAHRKKEQKPKKVSVPKVNDEVMVDFLIV